MHFVTAGSEAEVLRPSFQVPATWSLEAAQSFQEALHLSAPTARRVVEENTIPSWLWQRRANGHASAPERSVMDVLNRVVGAATYRGWQKGFWPDEEAASVFYDETRAALLTGRLVIAPRVLAILGLDWAYGQQAAGSSATPAPMAPNAQTLIVQNETIDALLRGEQPHTREKWQSFFESSLSHATTTLAFTDTMAQWGSGPSAVAAPSATLNLLAFRQDDGGIDAAGLRHATKLAVLLCELFYDEIAVTASAERPLAINMGNLAAMLMSLALPYNSEPARNTAAALAAIVTAAAASTSARIAQKVGSCEAFTAGREATLRALGNRLRATFNEKTDYDRLEVLPQTIRIDSGADLVLIATARYASEEALHLVRQHGLRHLHLTTITPVSALAPLLDSASAGVMAEAALACDYALGDEIFERRARPALRIALETLGYAPEDQKAILDHITGYRTLKAAPAISLTALGDKGLPDEALERIEAALPFVNHLRLAVTPWVIGLELCRAKLGLSDQDLHNPAFDMLGHLGFSAQEIDAANAFCCGHDTVDAVLELKAEHRALFETAESMPLDATLAMAAATQSFITDDVALTLAVPATLEAKDRATLVLKAWELGLKSLTLTRQAPSIKALHQAKRASLPTAARVMKRKTPSLSATHPVLSRKKQTTVAAKPKAKATASAVSLRRKASPLTGKTLPSKRG
jgi:hypothetical protein